MSSVIDTKCIHCNKVNTRRYGWLDPAQFTDPKAAFLTSVFHCAFCNKGNAVKIQYFSDAKMEIIEELDFKTLIKDDPIPFYIGGSSTEDSAGLEVLSETDALSLLNDVDE
jgi:hypothetical protein